MPIFISFLVPRAIAKPCTSRRGGRGANEGRHRALVQRTQCLGCKGWEKGRQFLPAARCHGDGRARAAASMNTHELGEPGGCTHCALNAKAPARPRSTKSCGCARDRRRPTALLLSLQSEVFEGLLRNQSVVTLYEPPETAALFEKFIRYLYCGGVSLLLHQAIPLHQLASKYRVWGLQRGVADYMRSHLASESSQGHVVGWYHYAARIGDTALQESCLQFLAWNLSSVLGSAEWASVSMELLLLLLERSDLVLHSELELYTAVEAWLARRQPEDAVAERVLRAIRYPMIAPSQLFRLQTQSAVLVRHYSAVQDLLFQAFQFHAASPLHFAKYFDVNCSMFLPRNYLAPSWGSQWVINNPARDDRSTSFQTQLGPSSHDSGKRVTWNVLFSPRWLPVSLRPVYSDSVSSAIQPVRIEDGRPRLVVTPATSSPDFAGVSFQKTVLVGVRQQGRIFVKHAYSFHQSSDETADFLAHADLQKRTSEYLIDNALHLHIIIKPVYHSLIKVKK
ncbi:BTB/POZ domain-containing protein 17 isoform X1 [Lagopus muta]|uniref:BTB/POZ domain-containing protein 17 isoform X1 n=1 Tax=Lagopus muta TaxID=64668 RepID=UPI00209EC918|nr:BTB/POZ domain-containing protein 17 isoform X1 [Lagopus muta]